MDRTRKSSGDNALVDRLLPGLMRASSSDAGLAALARVLDVTISELADVPTNPRISYRPFTIRKRGGGTRQIVAPSDSLKALQRRLLRRYLVLQPVHTAATAFGRGCSIAAHARRHLGQDLILTADLADFFPATRATRVRRWFNAHGWDGDALAVLTRLTVYRGGLPQGAPTSPMLSNVVNLRLDIELSELAEKHQARYSRYCDDLAFSWGTMSGKPEPWEAGGWFERLWGAISRRFRSPEWEAEAEDLPRAVEEVLGRYDYRVQSDKGWRLTKMSEQPRVTGLILDGGRLRLPAEVHQRIRRLKSRWMAHDEADRQRLAGYRGLLKMLK